MLQIAPYYDYISIWVRHLLSSELEKVQKKNKRFQRETKHQCRFAAWIVARY